MFCLQAKSKAADLKAKVAAQRLEEGAGPAADDTKDGGDDDDDGSPFTPPDDMKDYPLWALSVPWYFVFKSTIPPCGSSDYWRKWYLVSFFMSIAWIGFITHWMVEWCVRIGCMLKMPPHMHARRRRLQKRLIKMGHSMARTYTLPNKVSHALTINKGFLALHTQ